MPLNPGRLLLKSWLLIKRDYYILMPSVLLFIIINIVDSFFPLADWTKPDLSTQKLSALLIGMAVIQLYIQTVVVAMGRDILYRKRIFFPESIFLSLRKLLPIMVASFVLVLPAGLLIALISKLSAAAILMQPIIMIFMVLSIFIPIIVINDDLGIFTCLLKLFIFIRLNRKSFFIFGIYFLGIMMGLMLLSTLFYSIPYIGRTLLFPVSLGLTGSFLVIFSMMYYLEFNGKRC